MNLKDAVCLVLYLATELINFLLMYTVIFRMKINKKKKNWIITIFSLLIVHLSAGMIFSVYDATGISFLTMLVIPIFLIMGSIKKRIGLYLFAFFAPSAIASCATFLLSLLCHMQLADAQIHYGVMLTSQCIPILLVFVIYLYSKKTGNAITPVYIGKTQIIFYGIGAVCIWWMIGGMQALCQYDLPNRIITVIGSITCIACVIFVFLLLWQGIVARKEIQLKEEIQFTQDVVKLQEEHFQQIIVQDEKIRKLRHDMRGHMIVLKEYCKNQEYQKLEEYITSMLDAGTLDHVKCYTGNQGIDAVLNDLIEKAKKEGIEVQVNGTKFMDARLSTFEMCTILFNLIKNAIEGCGFISVGKHRLIQIKLLNYENMQYISIGNTTEKKVEINQGILYTTKKNKMEHGFGTQNVADVVRKHNGVVEYQVQDTWFEVQILL